ncbi:hypothetical protein FACS1894101_0950 [Betaproteobacteria bacterium]|nr:hypothetical protein FACS1894101_0950 [Betaproteobacteria bacterium]
MLLRSDKTLRRLFVLALSSVSVPVWAQGAITPLAGQSICCIDASGQRVCSDIAPRQCNGRALKIYNNQGMLVREVAARMTAEEKAEAAERARLEKQAQDAAREQRLKDRALVETYANLDALDRAQKRQEDSVKVVIADIRSLLDAAKKRKKDLDAEAEFYATSPKALPPDLAKQQKDEEFEIGAQTTLLNAKQKELDQIRAKFAEDRKRYTELTNKAANKAQN